MARTELERTVQPSILERLTDRDPRTPADPPITREESVRAYRASVLRDVEWLLNTRRVPITVPPTLGELRRSVFEYGLPDTLSIAIGTQPGREELVRWITDTLAVFEPRLSDVRVILADIDQVSAPFVHFSLSATLRMDPSPLQVVFDTVLDLARGGYAINDGATPGAAEA